MPKSFDVIVIGGGLAGIAAATRLARAGRRVALIEARSRFGGRVATLHEPSLNYPIELGPEWFDSYGTIHRLLSGLHLEMPPAAGDHWRRVGSELRDIEELADGGAEIHRRLQALDGADRPLARALSQCCAAADLRQPAEMLRHYVEGFHASDPKYLSLKWLMEVEENQPAGASELRSRDGLDRAVRALLREIGPSCTAYLDTIVERVRWQPGRAVVQCRSGKVGAAVHADAAIVTLPLGVLQLATGSPGSVQFTPALTSKRRAMSKLGVGPVVKINVAFDRAFWRDLPQLNEMLFLQDFSQPVPTWWSTRPVDTPLLVGWAAGPQVARLAGMNARELKQCAMQSLAHALQVPLRTVTERVRAVYWHDWQSDPFARGAYSWVKSGGVDAHRWLAAPLADTLFFAGEATCGSGFNATMDGAIQSGWRAADEVLSR